MDRISQSRNTPRADGISPCQIVYGRSIRTILPTLTESLGTAKFIESAKSLCESSEDMLMIGTKYSKKGQTFGKFLRKWG